MPSKEQIIDVINLKLDEAFISDVNNYKYNSQDSLVAWFDLDETLIDQSANSGQIASLNYRRETSDNNSDAVISKEAFNTTGPTYPQYSNARFNQQDVPNSGFGGRRHAKVVYNNPASIAFGSGGGDSAFSVSIWAKVNPDILSTTHPGRLFEFGTGGAGYAYRANIDKDGNVQLSLRRLEGGGTKFFTTTLSNFRTDYAGWNHYVFTYNGDESSIDVKIYINGESATVTTTSAGTYTGMGAGGLDFFIGAANNEQNQWNGFISQVSIFSSQISQENARAIYEGTSIGSYQDKTTYFSGDLSNPTRDVVKTLDKRIKVIHDCGVRKSSQKRNFDDMNTIDFVERELIASLGVEKDKTSTPYIALNTYPSYGISMTSKYGSNFISRQHRNTFEGDTEPFKESEKIFLGDGFVEDRKISIDVLDQSGLSRNVNQKDIIEIDLKPSTPTTFGIEAGVGSSATNDLMVYWNNSTKSWDKVGGTVLKPANIQGQLESGKIGFAPTSGFIIPNDKNNFDAAFKNYGMHIDNFGFPRHPKYEAGSNQYIDIGDYICKPFVVEKMSYEFDAVMHVDKQVASGFIESDTTTNFTQVGHNLAAYTFFILNERPDDLYEEGFVSTLSDGDNLSKVFATVASSDSAKKSSRDLVGYMQAVVFSDADDSNDQAYGKFSEKVDTTKLGSHDGFLSLGLSRELNISGSNFTNSSSSIVDADFAFSGSAVMSGSILENGSHESFGMTFNIGGARKSIADLGAYRGETLGEKLFPRGFGNNLKINQKDKSKSVNHSLFLGSTVSYSETTSIKKTFFTNLRKPNPYILMPGDRLIFGWQTPVPINCFDLDDSNGSSKMTINTSVGKLKLYGSFLSNNKVKKSNDIFYENNHVTRPIGVPPTDSYQIETRNQVKNSYISYQFDGSIPSRTAVSKNAQSDTIKSSIHFSHHKDEKEFIYDSYLPDFKNYLLRRGVETLSGIEITGASDVSIFTGHRNYAPVYVQGQKRQPDSKIFIDGKNASQSRKIFFTKGFKVDGTNDSFEGANSISYGMYNYNISKNFAMFNTRHFGHFADIIEQRRSYAHEFKGKVIYPLEVTFTKNKETIEPKESVAQNVYPHSESYFPFYDGGDLTFRTDDTTKIDAIVIDSIMLDETLSLAQEEKDIQELKNIILK